MRKCLSRISKILYTVQWSLLLQRWPNLWLGHWKSGETGRDSKETPKSSLIYKDWASGLFTHSINKDEISTVVAHPTISLKAAPLWPVVFHFLKNQEPSYLHDMFFFSARHVLSLFKKWLLPVLPTQTHFPLNALQPHTMTPPFFLTLSLRSI